MESKVSCRVYCCWATEPKSSLSLSGVKACSRVARSIREIGALAAKRSSKGSSFIALLLRKASAARVAMFYDLPCNLERSTHLALEVRQERGLQTRPDRPGFGG